MQKAIAGVAALAVVAAVGGLSYWAGSRNAPADAPKAAPAAAAKAPPGIVVEASKVSLAKLPQGLSAVGSLRSDETIILRPEVAA